MKANAKVVPLDSAQSERIIPLGRRKFELVLEDSPERDAWIATCLRRGGIERFVPHLGESRIQYLVRIQHALDASGAGTRLMAALLTPAGEPWDIDEAHRTTEHLIALDDEADAPVIVKLIGTLTQELMRLGVIRPYSI